MGPRTQSPVVGVRLHQFIVGAVPAAAYLVGFPKLVWVSIGLTVLAMGSVRWAIAARFYDRFGPRETLTDLNFHGGIYRFDEAVRLVLLGGGMTLLMLGQPLGWLPVLAASAVAILQGVSGFSVTMLLYALGCHVLRGAPREEEACPEAPSGRFNVQCLICRTFAMAPHERCRWCRLDSVRWCCGLQISLLLLLLMVIAFLLSAALGPVTTKVLVTLSLLSVVALGLAINRQTVSLINALDGLARERAREVRRCDFLRRLALADGVDDAARTTVDYIAEMVGAGRVSVMVPKGDILRIVASHGIPRKVAEKVAVPIHARICGQVFSTGRPVIFRNIEAERPGATLGLKGTGAAATLPLASTPMGAAGQKVGCINATETPTGEFTDDDIKEMEFAAEAAGISLAAQLANANVDRANYDTIRALAMAVEARDPYTHGHSLRVQAWSTALGREMGLEGDRLATLSLAAELHDVGKIAVPDALLNGRRKLTDNEWMVIRQHPFRGVQMIEHIGFLADALPAILHHHERLDGNGYPEGRKGDEIPLEARILAVVDSYDAMTSERPYRAAMPHEKAAEELRRCAGTQFDERCVDAFLEVVGDPVRAGEVAAAMA